MLSNDEDEDDFEDAITQIAEEAAEVIAEVFGACNPEIQDLIQIYDLDELFDRAARSMGHYNGQKATEFFKSWPGQLFLRVLRELNQAIDLKINKLNAEAQAAQEYTE